MTSARTYSSGDVAKICDVNQRTVIRWIERGELIGFKLPGRGNNRITSEELFRFLQRNGMPLPPELQPAERRVLIVDDDKNVALALQRVLRRIGYHTRVADDGFRAGALLGAYQPDLITLDLSMPGLDGFDVIRFIRHHESYRHIRILVISGLDDIQLQRARESGADACLPKPFDNQELADQVCALTARS